nr:Zgc:110598 protein [Danio rerio]
MAAPAVAANSPVIENMPETAGGATENSAEAQKRPQFGTRFLTDPRQVFQHNAWDNVEWSAEQEEAALKKVQENSQPLPAEKQEFPELAPQQKHLRGAEEKESLEHMLNGDDVSSNHTHYEYPGASASYRILEVGCGVGNTVFPILKTNNDPGLFVYCCDFSSTAVDLVKVSDRN